jgi:hypothetical protein
MTRHGQILEKAEIQKTDDAEQICHASNNREYPRYKSGTFYFPAIYTKIKCTLIDLPEFIVKVLP